MRMTGSMRRSLKATMGTSKNRGSMKMGNRWRTKTKTKRLVAFARNSLPGSFRWRIWLNSRISAVRACLGVEFRENVLEDLNLKRKKVFYMRKTWIALSKAWRIFWKKIQILNLELLWAPKDLKNRKIKAKLELVWKGALFQLRTTILPKCGTSKMAWTWTKLKRRSSHQSTPPKSRKNM